MSAPDYLFDRVTREIRQQMEGILALTARLASPLSPADARACVQGVAAAAETVRRITAASSDIRAALSDTLTLTPGPVALRDLVDRLDDRWRQRIQGSRVTLLVSYDGPPEGAAMLDADRVLQVFDGFVAHALSAASGGAVEAMLRVKETEGGFILEGRVRSASTAARGEFEVDVREIEAMFGLETALGFMLARHILRRLGGRARTLHNPGLGETLSFAFRTESPPELPVETAAEGLSAHILVVDDNATNRMVAETLCSMFGCTTEPAADGEEAVTAAASGRFDLILMDIRMPRLDGVAATRRIRALPDPVGQIPIIALTANADVEETAAYLRAGMNGVVEKPMKPDQLLQVVLENLPGGPGGAIAAT
ncbi:response regulator [Phenylobacterium sp.]|uniref:response regulator n=1 Tax=Phenylobacterium sp. TaxID=1871053 RepID=UPI0025D1E881|nr:response regulator [Phenylobacterium sp.]MCA3720873.1 response regulator [Phenylobacterium sp.]